MGAGRGGEWEGGSWREAGGSIEERSGEMDRDWGRQRMSTGN